MKLPLFASLLILPAAPALAQHEGHGAPPDEPAAAEAMNAEAMTGALGPYSATREASGTAWQPESTPHSGAHVTAGRWSLMGHATLFGVYDWQSGPRGGEKGFVAGMAMGSARRPLGPGTVQLRVEPQPRRADGAERLPAAARLGRDGGRNRAFGRPPASARSLHGAFGELRAAAFGAV